MQATEKNKREIVKKTFDENIQMRSSEKAKNEALQDRVLRLLPFCISAEIFRLVGGRVGGSSTIEEICIRREALCTLRLGKERIRLAHSPGREEMDRLVDRLVSSAMYAHRENIASGFISLEGGVRVGVCGSASYESGRLVGIGEITSLLFRFPPKNCDFAESLYTVIDEGIGKGMLIYSPPGVGKTTALRAIAKRLGAKGLRIAVVDERGEFPREDFKRLEVDVLSGYRRPAGIEIATRTLSPELIIIDEIGGDEGEELMGAVRCGIPIIASAHGEELDDLRQRKGLRTLIDGGVFSCFVGIERREGKYELRVEKV